MSSPVPAIQPPHPFVLAMPKAHLQALCKLYGTNLAPALVSTDDGSRKPIDGPRLLWAMSGRESSFGQQLHPRFEPAYFVGGHYYKGNADVRAGVALYGRDFACSYGPLQIMCINAKGFTPLELGEDPEKALAAAVARLRLETLGRQRGATIAEICQSWNGGHVGAVGEPGYVEEVIHYYLTEEL